MSKVWNFKGVIPWQVPNLSVIHSFNIPYIINTQQFYSIVNSKRRFETITVSFCVITHTSEKTHLAYFFAKHNVLVLVTTFHSIWGHYVGHTFNTENLDTNKVVDSKYSALGSKYGETQPMCCFNSDHFLFLSVSCKSPNFIGHAILNFWSTTLSTVKSL